MPSTNMGSRSFLTPVPGYPILSSRLTYCTLVVHTHTRRQNTHKHNKEKNLYEKDESHVPRLINTQKILYLNIQMYFSTFKEVFLDHKISILMSK